MTREERRNRERKFASQCTSNVVTSECAVAFFLKEERVDSALYDPEDKVNEIFYSLATKPELYAIFKLAVLLTENEEGDKLYNESVEKYNLLNDGTESPEG